MKPTTHRILFYTADLRQITGKGERTCQRMMQLMRDFFALREHQPLTVYHACDYLGLSIDEMMPFIKF